MVNTSDVMNLPQDRSDAVRQIPNGESPVKFVFLVGLPGSGKTHYGSQMSGLFLDDICRTGGPGRLKEAFSHQTVFVADPSLCRPAIRRIAEAMVKDHHPGCVVEWVFWANDPDQCWVNVQARGDKRLISKQSIYALSKHYHIPNEEVGFPPGPVEVREVWR